MFNKLLSRVSMILGCVLMLVLLTGMSAYAADEFNPANPPLPVKNIGVRQDCTDSLLDNNDVNLYKVTVLCDGKLQLSFDHDYIDDSDCAWNVSIFKFKKGVYQKIGENVIEGNCQEPFYFRAISCEALDIIGIRVESAGNVCDNANYTIKNEFTLDETEDFELGGKSVSYIYLDEFLPNILDSDADYYKIIFDKEGRLKIYFSHEGANENDGWDISIYRKESKSFRLLGRYTVFGTDSYERLLSVIGCKSDDEIYLKVERCQYKKTTSARYVIRASLEQSDFYETDNNNSFEKAKSITAYENDSKYLGGLMGKEDANYYYVTMRDTGTLSLMLEHAYVNTNSGWNLSVYKQVNYGLVRVASYDIKGKNVGEFKIPELGFKKGERVYIRVSQLGEYYEQAYYLHTKLNVTDSFEKESNNRFETATVIKADTDIYGNIVDSHDIDYYKFVADKDGAVMISLDFDHKNVTKDRQWNVVIYKEQNLSPDLIKTYSFATNSEKQQWIPFIGCSKGDTIWIAVDYSAEDDIGGNSVYFGDNYVIQTKFDSSKIYEREINNTFGNATIIDSEGTVYGQLYSALGISLVSFLDDKDYYTFERLGGEEIRYQFIHDEKDDNKAYWELSLYVYKKSSNSYELCDSDKVYVNDPGTKDIFPEFSGSFGGAAKFYILVKGSGVTGTKYGLVLKSDKGIITKQPSDCATALGKEATFSAEASGYSVKYGWKVSKDNGNTWTDYCEATAENKSISFKVTKDNYADLYKCYIVDGYGTKSESKVVGIKLNATIIEQPEDDTVYEGELGEFSVKAAGSGLKYQWMYAVKGSDVWTDWTTKKTASITVAYQADRNGMKLKCRVTDGAGNTVTSKAVTLDYVKNNGPTITKQPMNASVTKNETASFAVTAVGKDLKYLWQYKTAGTTTWTDWTTKTTASITVVYQKERQGMSLRCRITDAAGKSVNSNTVTLVYNNLGPVITKQPVSASVNEGEIASFSIGAGGMNLKYLWQYKKKGETTWTNWTTKTKPDITVAYDKSRDGMSLRCELTDGSGKTIHSNVVTLTYKEIGPDIIKQPVSAKVNAGTIASFSLTATGNKLSYLWQYKKKGETSWTDWTAKTTADITVAYEKSRDGMSLRCRVTDGSGRMLYSDVVTLTYIDGPAVSKQPVSATVKEGEIASFSVSATGTKLTYLWQYKKAGETSWTDWTTKTKASITVAYDKSRDGMSLRCKLTDGNGNTAYSNTVTLKYTK